MPTQKAHDSYTDTAGTVIASHTPDQGSAWVDDSSATFKISAGGDSLAAQALGFCRNTTAVGNDQQAQCTVRNTSVPHGLMTRLDSSHNGYLNYVAIGANLLGLYREDAGSATQLALVSPSPALAQNDIVLHEIVGSNLTSYVNAVSKATGSDGTYTSGATGVWTSDAGDALLDEFFAYDFSAAGGGGRVSGRLLMGVGN